MYITFSRTRGQCNSVLWVFTLRSFICLLQTRLSNLEGDHVNSIEGTAVRHTDMKLAPHHPCIGLLHSIALVRMNDLFRKKNLLPGFSHALSEMAFSSWHAASVGGKNEKNCSDFSRIYSVACKLGSVTHSKTALNFKGVSLSLNRSLRQRKPWSWSCDLQETPSLVSCPAGDPSTYIQTY